MKVAAKGLALCIGAIWGLVALCASVFAQANFDWVSENTNTAQLAGDSQLRDIWGSSQSNVFVVGDAGVVLHYNGGAWSRVQSGVSTNLRSVWGTATSVYVAGDEGVLLNCTAGGCSSLNSGTDEDLFGIWGDASGSSIFAVGSSGAIRSFNGSGNPWMEASSNLTTTPQLRGVWINENGTAGFAAGSNKTILEYNGTGWSVVENLPGDIDAVTFFEDVWGASPGAVFAVGYVPQTPRIGRNVILQWDGTSWRTFYRGENNVSGLYGVWGRSADDVFFAGLDIVQRFFDDELLDISPSGEDAVVLPVEGLWGSESREVVFAVGNAGRTFRFIEPPVARARVSDNIVPPGATVTLDGSQSTNPDGTVQGLSYVWEQTGGPGVTLTGTPGSAERQFIALSEDQVGSDPVTLTFELTVTSDATGQSDTESIRIFVTDIQPPRARAQCASCGEGDTTLPGSQVTLDGSQSSSINGISSFEWTQTDGTPVFDEEPESGETVTFTAPQTEGQLEFNLKVTDTLGATDEDSLTVSVSVGNQPPVALALQTQLKVAPNEMVTLDGSPSFDPDGLIPQDNGYHWAQAGLPGVDLSPATGRGPSQRTFMAPDVSLPTALYFDLDVFDDEGFKSNQPARVVVLVEPAGQNLFPAAVASRSSSRVLEGTSIELIGSSSFDPDGAISLHEWSYIPMSGVPAPGPFENGPVTVADPAAFDAPEVNRDGARLNFELRVRDDGSPALDDTDTTFVNIIDRDDPDPNQPPVIEGSGRPVTAAPGGNVTFQPGLSDPNGDPLRYNWNQASGPSVANFLTPAARDLQGPPYNADLSFTVPVSAQQGDQIRFRLLVEEIDGPFQAFSEPLFTVNVSGEPVDPPPEPGGLVADAGPDLEVDEGAAAITLNGSNSSPAAAITRYQWSFIGTGAGTLSNTDSAQAAYTPPADVGSSGASDTIQLTVSDAEGNQDSNTAQVIVLDTGDPNANRAPVALAGPDQSVPDKQAGGQSAMVTLDASNSFDPEGGQLTYQWSRLLLPGWSTRAISLDPNSGRAVVTFNAPDVPRGGESYGFEVTVTDDMGLQSTDLVVVNVRDADSMSPNQSPLADAGADLTADFGELVALDGSGSSDPDGSVSLHLWQQIGGTPVQLSDPRAASPTFTAPSGITGLVFRLLVLDDEGLSDTDLTLVNVTDGSNGAPVFDDPGDKTLIADPGDTVTLVGPAATDPDADPMVFKWRQTDGTPVGFLSNASGNLRQNDFKELRFVAPSETGVLVFEYLVADDNGLGTSVTYTVEVGGTPGPGPGDLTASAGPVQNVVEGALVTLDGSNSAFPSDGTEARIVAVTEGPVSGGGAEVRQEADSYSWERLPGEPSGGTLSNVDSPRATFQTPEDVGSEGQSFRFRLTVSDGGDTDTDTTIVNVLDDDSPDSNAPPEADAGPVQIVRPGETVILSGLSSSDPDDGIADYAWEQTLGPEVSLVNADSAQSTFTAPENVDQSGIAFVFELTVRDTMGLRSTDSTVVNVVVEGGNRPPEANAGPDQTVNPGATVTLNATASTDPDEDALAYLWHQTAGPPVTLSDPVIGRPSFIAPQVPESGATLRFELLVRDERGLVDLDRSIVVVVVEGANQPPAANAGTTQSGLPGATITLDGSASRDPEGDDLAFKWKQVAGPPVTLSDPAAAQPTFVVPDFEGLTMVFELTVSDGALEATDDTEVTIGDAPVDVPSFGGSEAGDVVLATVDPNEARGFNVYLSREVAQEDIGPGRIYLSLEILGVPAWNDLMWLRPSDDRVSSLYVMLAGQKDRLFPGAENHSFFEGQLTNTPQNDLGPFFIGEIESLRGLVVIMKTWYLVEGEAFNAENLKRIQTVMVSVQSGTDPLNPKPQFGGFQDRGEVLDDVVLHNVDPDFVTGFDLQLSQQAVTGQGKLFIGLEVLGIPAWEDLMWLRPSNDLVPPYLVLGAAGDQFLTDDNTAGIPADESFFFEGVLSAAPANLPGDEEAFFVGDVEGARGLVLVFRSFYLEAGMEMTTENLQRIQSVMVAIPSEKVR